MAAPTEPEAIPAEYAETAYDIARDIPSRVRTENRPFIANVIARAIADAVTEDRASRVPVDGAEAGPVWRTMDTAPLDGKHCILAVPEPDGFIYSVQGAYQNGQWNCAHRDNVKPLYWMPNVRLPRPGEESHPAPASPDAEIVRENERLRRALGKAASIVANSTAATSRHELSRRIRELLSKHGVDR